MLSSSDFHSEFSQVIISTHEVGVMGLSISKEISPAALNALLYEPNNPDFSWTSKKPITASFEIEKEFDESYKLYIKAKLNLWSTCVKCLDPIEHSLNLDFVIRMLKATNNTHAGIAGEDEPTELIFESDSVLDDCLVGYFALESIDLGLILREQIFLEMPDYPHCAGELAVQKSACNPAALKALAGESLRENPFVKLLKTK